MKKVLILGVASVQMDAIVELKKMGVKTYAIAQADDGPGSKVADYFEKINFTDKEKVVNFINEHKIDCVYSVGSDLAMPISTYISEKLNLPFFVTSEIAKVCNNKNKMREFFGNNFDGNINYQVLKNKNTDIKLDFPFIMKPSDSQGQRGVHLIHNFEGFVNHFEECQQFSRSGLVIIEEYIDGPELSINAYIVDGEVAFMVHSDRDVWPQFEGGLVHRHIVPAKSSSIEIENAMIDLVNRTAKKLEIVNGPLYFQVKLSNNKPYIIEVTPRLDGCHMWNLLRQYTGVNLIKLTFEHLLFGRTDELQKFKKNHFKYTLEFMCDYPNKQIDYKKFNIPNDSLYSFKYYDNEDLIRPINNRYEKVGYYITKDGES